jgi:phage gp45-like
MADGLYFGGLLNGTPAQYVQFTEGGINIVSPSKVTVVAPAVEVDASATITYNSPLITLNGTVAQGNGSFGGTTSWKGNMHIVGDVDIDGVLKNNGVPVGSTHTHHENGAGSNTNPPNP